MKIKSSLLLITLFFSVLFSLLFFLEKAADYFFTKERYHSSLQYTSSNLAYKKYLFDTTKAFEKDTQRILNMSTEQIKILRLEEQKKQLKTLKANALVSFFIATVLLLFCVSVASMAIRRGFF